MSNASADDIPLIPNRYWTVRMMQEEANRRGQRLWFSGKHKSPVISKSKPLPAAQSMRPHVFATLDGAA